MAPEGTEGEHLEGCSVKFPTWTISFKRKRFDRGKRIDYGGANADPFWTNTTLALTLEGPVESFVINSVRVSSIYDVSVLLVKAIFVMYLCFMCRALIF